ncbi:MAG TPA: hypothetical protein VHG71_13585 [Verrucomicrobiae bacterium]|nr:hypothetical protein [Verrucomicrobiae bacterium]
MSAWTESYLWASLIWGAVASGYWIYGWRQKSWVPLAGGGAMMAASIFMAALPMTLACIAVMAIVYWMAKQGY